MVLAAKTRAKSSHSRDRDLDNPLARPPPQAPSQVGGGRRPRSSREHTCCREKQRSSNIVYSARVVQASRAPFARSAVLIQ